MGFRKDSVATVWEIKPRTESLVTARVSISRLDKKTNEYVQDWGGFVAFIGTACANKALQLKANDRIRLGDVDVVNKYDAEKKVTYTNFNIYSFEMAKDGKNGSSEPKGGKPGEDDVSDNLPF